MRILMCFMLLLTAEKIQSQSLLYGQLTDSETGAGIPYANIGIVGTSLGTAASSDGTFQLKVKDIGHSKMLKISCIGYHTRSYALDSLLQLGPVVHRFNLRPDIELLDEVVISEANITAQEIIMLAISSINENYYQQPFNLEMFSTIVASDAVTKKDFKVESVMTGYYSGYKKGIKRTFEIDQVRKTGEDPVKSQDYGYWPTFEIYQADQITSEFEHGIFNPLFLEKFELQYAGVSTYEDDTVYQINYRLPKPTTKITGYGQTPKRFEGTIFITTATNAVVRHEIATESFSYMVIYKKYEGKYFPYYFSGKRANKLRLPGGTREFANYNSIAVTKIILEDVKAVGAKRNEFDIYLTEYDPEFWEANYPIKE